MILIQRLLALLCPLLLCGCVLTSPPVLGPDESEEVEGIAGHWVSIDDDTTLLINVEEDGSLLLRIQSPSQPQDLAARTARLDPFFHMLEILVNEDGTQGLLTIVQVLPDYLVFFPISIAELQAAAKETGLLVEARSAEELRIVPGQSKRLVVKTLEKLKLPLDTDEVSIYKRYGAVAVPDSDQASVIAMAQLVDQGQIPAAITMGRQLSNYGHVTAQLKLADLALRGQLDIREGLRHGSRAAAAGNARAERLLVDLYDAFLSTHSFDRTVETRQAFYWLYVALNDHPADKERIMHTVNALLIKECAIVGFFDKRKCFGALFDHSSSLHKIQTGTHEIIEKDQELKALRAKRNMLHCGKTECDEDTPGK